MAVAIEKEKRSPWPKLLSRKKAVEANGERQPAAGRLTSLDAFRGLTILLMLLVNNIALDTFTPHQLEHAPWNGPLTLADFVFPWFLLCVGLAIPFSVAGFTRKGLPQWRYEVRVILRAATLILLGCLIECAAEKKLVFSMGVLQLIGFAYLIGAWCYSMPPARRAIVGFFFLLAYGCALKYFPVPGSSIGNLTEAGNWSAYINKTFLGAYNLEGLTSAIPTGGLVLIGTLFGDVLLKQEDRLKNLFALIAGGIAMMIAGIVWSGALPYNKPIWTPPYILYSAGIGLLVLAAFYLATDALPYKKWALPLVVFGANPIVAYALPILVKLTMFGVWTMNTSAGKATVQDASLHYLVDHLGRVPGGWAYTLLYIGVWWLVLLAMYRKKLFVRL